MQEYILGIFHYLFHHLGGRKGWMMCSIYFRTRHPRLTLVGPFFFFFFFWNDLQFYMNDASDSADPHKIVLQLWVQVYKDSFLYHSGPAKKNHKSAIHLWSDHGLIRQVVPVGLHYAQDHCQACWAWFSMEKTTYITSYSNCTCNSLLYIHWRRQE